jgi:hypothetical protein
MLPPHAAWARLRDMKQVVAHQPAAARAVRCLPLYDQLGLTFELLRQDDWPEFDEPEPLPPNVVRFRPRVNRPDDHGRHDRVDIELRLQLKRQAAELELDPQDILAEAERRWEDLDDREFRCPKCLHWWVSHGVPTEDDYGCSMPTSSMDERERGIYEVCGCKLLVRERGMDARPVVAAGRDLDAQQPRPVRQDQALLQGQLGQPVEPAGGGQVALRPGEAVRDLDQARDQVRLGARFGDAGIGTLARDQVAIGVALHEPHLGQSRQPRQHLVMADGGQVTQHPAGVDAPCRSTSASTASSAIGLPWMSENRANRIPHRTTERIGPGYGEPTSMGIPDPVPSSLSSSRRRAATIRSYFLIVEQHLAARHVEQAGRIVRGQLRQQVAVDMPAEVAQDRVVELDRREDALEGGGRVRHVAPVLRQLPVGQLEQLVGMPLEGDNRVAAAVLVPSAACCGEHKAARYTCCGGPRRSVFAP